MKKHIHRMRGRQVDPKSLDELKTLIGAAPIRRDLLIEYLHLIQDTFHHISARHITALADLMRLSMAEVYEVATFYHHFDVIKEGEPPPPTLTVRVCNSITCEMFGAKALIETLKRQTSSDVRVQPVPCVGRCHGAPVAVVGTNPVEQATPRVVAEKINAGQTTIQIENNYIHFDHYVATGGYKLLQQCHGGERHAVDVINILKDANLRGLGGAGFPAGVKWEILCKQKKPRLIAVNIDEGEPGTFKDRFYLETDPHRFLEGMLIAAWAIEAKGCYIYLRDEYAGCREILQRELAQLAISLPAPLPEIELRRGAGAYICGEESAMIESIEGKRGMPRLRPPFVAEVGLFGRPTLEHNMETLHWVREIIEKGADWFTAQGRHGRRGLRSFSVSGRIKKPGVYLAPAGITLNDLIAEYCDGMLDGHELYGYFPGGASGGILPGAMADTPLDFDTLNEHGSFIGSAAIIVLSQKDNARKLALNTMRFFSHESCGQCTPCRVGTSKAIKLMEKDEWDKPLLEDIAAVMGDASICGLGQAASNPLLTTMRYFPQEFTRDD